ncbi:MAG TPA: hypothetical protein VID94_16920 [Acidimicrobiales bacterium]
MIRRFLPFTIALVIYVILGVTVKSWVLNWVIGPLFLLLTLDVLPRAFGARPFFALPPVDEPAEDTPIP